MRSSLFSQGLFQRDAEFVGHQGHDGVDPRDGQAQGPAHVADRRPGRQRAERADLGHVRHAVFFLDVLNHLAAPLLAEVDVDIGRLAAALIQKTLEQQVVLQRANVAQVQPVGDQRANARTAGRGLNALLAGETDKIPHDQEVVGEAQLVDHPQLAIEPGHHLGRQFAVPAQRSGRLAIALLQSRQAQIAEILLRRLALRQA